MTETVLLTIFGVILWAATHTNSPTTDTVTLYTLRTDTPEFKAFENSIPVGNINVAAPTISLAVWYQINSTCMNPDALQHLALTEPSFFSSTNFPAVPTAPTSEHIMAKLLYTPHLLTSPLCRCLAATLVTYNSLYPTLPSNKSEAENADKAFKACFSTNGHTPQQRQWFESNYNTDKIFTRKSMSKVSFALIICLSFAFNVLYGSLDFGSANFYELPNLIKMGLMAGIVLAQLLTPIQFSNAAHGSSIIALTAFIIVPAAVLEFFLMEYAWRYLKTQNRAIHVHPYAFCITLISLNAIALFETGVFDFGTLVYYICISHALSMAYAATLFFTHYQKNEAVDVHSLTGYIVLLAAATFLVISGATPFHPTNGIFNLISLLPWIFTVCVFGFAIFIEHTFHNCKNENSELIPTKTSNLYFEGYALLVMVVLVYFMLKLWNVSFGDTILSNAGGVLFRYNYAFLFDMNPNIRDHYSIP